MSNSSVRFFVFYLGLVDEEDDIGDCVDCHVDAQLNRATVTDPGPDTHRKNQEGQRSHTHTHVGNTITQRHTEIQ